VCEKVYSQKHHLDIKAVLCGVKPYKCDMYDTVFPLMTHLLSNGPSFTHNFVLDIYLSVGLSVIHAFFIRNLSFG